MTRARWHLQTLSRNLPHIRILVPEPRFEPRAGNIAARKPQVVTGIRAYAGVGVLRELAQSGHQGGERYTMDEVFEQHARAQSHVETSIDVADDGQHGGEQVRLGFDQSLHTGQLAFLQQHMKPVSEASFAVGLGGPLGELGFALRAREFDAAEASPRHAAYAERLRDVGTLFQIDCFESANETLLQ